MDEVSKILTSKKKDHSTDTSTPQKFVHFPLNPQKYCRDQMMPTGLTPQERLWSHASEKFIHRVRG